LTPELLERIRAALWMAPNELLNVGALNIEFYPKTEAQQDQIIEDLYLTAWSLAPIRLINDGAEVRPTNPFMNETEIASGYPAAQWWGVVKAIVWALAESEAVDHKIMPGPGEPYGPVIPAISTEVITPVVVDDFIITPEEEIVPVVVDPVEVIPVVTPTTVTTIPTTVTPTTVVATPGGDNSGALLSLMALFLFS